MNQVCVPEEEKECQEETISIQADSNLTHVDGLQIEKDDAQEFNSGIIPEVMTSDVKKQNVKDGQDSTESSELCVSFELSGDESVSIELTPTNNEENLFLDEETGTSSKKRTRRDINTIDSKDETTDQENNRSKEESIKREAGNTSHVLQVSFEKVKTENKSSYKDLTDESLNTSGFDISSIINRLEDEDDDEMPIKRGEGMTPPEITDKQKEAISPKSKSSKKEKTIQSVFLRN